MSNIIIDLIKFSPSRHYDDRGFFVEIYNKRKYLELGMKDDFVQDNCSLSNEVGTLRGLHFQSPPHEQGKLVRCTQGAIFDVAVDIRKGSPTFCQWQGFELTEDNGVQVYIPPGYAHGFVTLKPDSEIFYKCTNYYAPESEGSIIWNDPDIGINWPISNDPIVSNKDKNAPLIRYLENPFIYGTNS